MKHIFTNKTDLQKSSTEAKKSSELTAVATKSRDQSKKDKRRIALTRVEKHFATLREIGENFGVSRQYVHRVLTHAGVPTMRAKMQRYTVCKVCDQKVEKSLAKTHIGKCHGEYYFISVHCHNCNASWSMRRGVFKQKLQRGDRHIYCSRECYIKDRYYAD